MNVDQQGSLLSTQDEQTIAMLNILRESGRSVAVHNDYKQDGVSMTFWLFTHPDGTYVKGEGRTDYEALLSIFAQLKERGW